MSISPDALTTLPKAKDFLRIDPSIIEHDTFIETLIDSCSEQIERACRRKFKARDLVKKFKSDIPHFNLDFPMVSLSELKVDNSILVADDYLIDLELGTVEVLAEFNWAEPLIVEVNYRAGFEAIPKSLDNACQELVTYKYKLSREDRVGLDSKSIADASASFLTDGTLPTVAEVINLYRRQKVVSV